MGNKQYHKQLDKVTLRNHWFLRKMLPVVDTLDYSPKQPPPQRLRPINSEPLGDTPEMMKVEGMDEDKVMVEHHTTDIETEENQHPIIHLPASLILLSSTRVTQPPRPLSQQM